MKYTSLKKGQRHAYLQPLWKKTYKDFSIIFVAFRKLLWIFFFFGIIFIGVFSQLDCMV